MEMKLHKRAICMNRLDLLIDAHKTTGFIGDVSMFNLAVTLGNVEIVRYLYDNECIITNLEDLFLLVIARGHIHIVKLFLDLCFEPDYATLKECIICDRQEIFSLILEKHPELLTDKILAYSIKSSNKKYIEYLVRKQCPCGYLSLTAACKKGDHVLFSYLLEKSNLEEREDFNESMIYALDYVTEVKILEALHAFQYGWDSSSFYCIVNTGNMKCIEYLYSIRCPFDEDTFRCAFDNETLDILKYLDERRCPYDYEEIELDECSNKEIATYVHDVVFVRDNRCERNCKRCHANRSNEVEDMWYLLDNDRQNLIQWLPRELLEDTITIMSY